MSNNRTHLLADHTVVDQAFAMRRTPGQPVPVQDDPVLPAAWAYGSVLRDRKTGLFRMWYLGARVYREYFATSEDGIRWDLPDLGILPTDERGLPNAFLGAEQSDANGRPLIGPVGPEGFCVLDAEMEDHPQAKARFTAMYLAGVKEGESGFCIAWSDDGLKWTASKHNPVVPGWMDSNNGMLWDSDRKRYVIYGRPPVYVSASHEVNRVIGRLESEDLVHWSPPEIVLDTDERDADPWDQVNEAALGNREGVTIRGKNRQFYGISAFRSHGLYLGLAQMYDVPSGGAWLELVHSRDGIHWHREALREPFMAPRKGTWEYPMLIPAVTTPPVAVGDEQWIYYSASQTSHHERGTIDQRGIGCQRVPTDRWVGYHSATEEAELLTRPIEAAGSLTLNAATQGDGDIRVALAGAWGEEIEGYTLEDATPITGDSLRQVVRWGDRTRLPGGHGALRLRIRSRNASVWAFTVGG